MAINYKNILVKYLSGKIGKQIVFKNYGGKTVMSMYPDMSKIKPSQKQTDENEKFKMANIYAKQAMKDPELYAFYRSKIKGNQRVNNLAVRDFYHPPVVHSILYIPKETSLHIEASDNFKVTRVEIRILNKKGKLLQQGQAHEKSHKIWAFPLEVSAEHEVEVEAKAYDLPGNSSLLIQCVHIHPPVILR